MNLQPIHGHTIDVDLLPESGWVLDVGCRDLIFAREILKLRGAMIVLAFDPAPDVEVPDMPGVAFARTAVVGKDFSGPRYSVGQGEECRLLTHPGVTGAPEVCCVPIASLVQGGENAVGAWLPIQYALVKLDCEGSEFDILENWPGPIAQQISVEFHDYMDPRRWNDRYFADLFAGPLRDYRVLQHEATRVGPNATASHWDSLLVLR